MRRTPASLHCSSASYHRVMHVDSILPARRNLCSANLRLSVSNWLLIVAWLVITALSLLKYCYLAADFPNDSPWMIDQAKFTDEGWWASAAVMHQIAGHWYVAGDYNPAVALPVWPMLLGVLFHLTGVSVFVARALNVTLSVATLGLVFALMRRYAANHSAATAMIAVLLIAASPFAFFFNRLATLDTLVVFEFLLIFLVASYASAKVNWHSAAIALLIATMILTKTTAVVLVPAVFWMTWKAIGAKRKGLLRSAVVTGLIPAALVKFYAVVISYAGYSADYRYFFAVNAMPPIEWNHTYATLIEFLNGCLWIDRTLCFAAPVVLLIAVCWKRRVWRNPLFTAWWIALGGQALFLFSRQEDFAPRYYLPMLAPLVIIIAIAYGEIEVQSRRIAFALSAMLVLSAAFNVGMILQMLSNREYQFIDAASSIQRIIESDPQQKKLMLGISGSQISLMTGIPSINDSYGTEDLKVKVLRYQPGWYLAWNTAEEQEKTFLADFRVEKVASYPAFDDEDRNQLILYKLVYRANLTNH